MAKDYRKKRISENNSLIQLLETENYWRHVLILIWQNSREIIFNYLEKEDIEFNSTKEGILKFLHEDFTNEEKSNLLTLYTLGVIAEWDVDFKVNKSTLEKSKKIYKQLMSSLKIKNGK